MRRLLVLPVAAGLIVIAAVDFVTTRSSVGYLIAKQRIVGSGLRSSEPAEDDAAAREVLRAAPLSAAAYFALARAAEAEGDVGRAKDLAERAVRVDPRLSAARMWVATQKLKEGRVEEAVADLDILLRVRQRLGRPLVVLLGQLAATPDGRRIISTRFAGDRRIIEILQNAAASGVPPEALIELVSRTDLRAIPNGVETAQEVIVGALIRADQPQQARAAWYRLAARAGPGELIYDGGFQGKPGAPPFNWTLITNSDVETAQNRSGGPAGAGFLSVQPYGSLPTLAAHQTVVLGAGSHVLRYAVAGDRADQAGADPQFRWLIRCTSGPAIASMPIAPPSMEWTRRAHRFTVPADCPMQTVAIEKLGSERSGGSGIRLSAVSLAPES